MNNQYENIGRFMGDEGWSAFRKAVFLLTISIVAYATLLAAINTGVAALNSQQDRVDGFRLLVVQFLFFFAAYNGFRWLAFVQSNQLAEGMVTKLWTRIVNKLRRLELRSVEKLDRGKVYADLSSDLDALSFNLFRIVFNIADALLIVIYLAFLAVVSLPALCIALLGGAGVLYIYNRKPELATGLIRQVKSSEGKLLNSLHNVFYGFKEMKLNAGRSDAVFNVFRARATESERYRVEVGELVFRRELFSQTTVFVMLGAAVFILPLYGAIDGGSAMQIIALLVFLITPLTALTGALDGSVYVNGILGSMYDLEQGIDEELKKSPPPLPLRNGSPYRDFHNLSFQGIRFSYGDPQANNGFSLGPLDLEVRRGETVFIVGGNGAGKSTAFKLLTGLYRPQAGSLLVDGKSVPWNLIAQYRQLVAAVFGDFHLFDRFYGMEDADEARVAELLHFMQLDDKVTFSEGRFSTQDLSTGQRKRLALITSLMEDREIYFLDEWAADQDWQFREYFYTTILPELKRQGKTVIAITHDRQYLHAADKVMQLDLGQLVQTRFE